MRPILLYSSLTLVAALACDAPTEPTGPTAIRRLSLVRPSIDSAMVWSPGLRDGGVMYLKMTANRSSVTLPPEEYFEVDVESTGGDVERLRVGREFLRDSIGLARHDITVELYSAADQARLMAQLGSTTARVTGSMTNPFGTVFLSVYVFEDTERVLRSVRGVRGVEYAERFLVNTLFELEPGFDPFARDLVGALPFDRGSAVPSNGEFTAMPGDTIRARYVQPTGDTLVVTGVVP